jgi:polyhydroxyalkanoate synthesis regulator phasin
MPPPVNLDDDDDDEYLRRQQTELDRLKNRNRNLEEDLRRLADGRPMDHIGIQAQATGYSKGVQGSNHYMNNGMQTSIPHSVKSGISEVDRLRARIADLENELER